MKRQPAHSSLAARLGDAEPAQALDAATLTAEELLRRGRGVLNGGR